MPKTFIKQSAGWKEMKSVFIKKTTGWAEIKNVFIKKTTGWVKVFTKASLPDTTTSPSIRTTNNSGTGTIYDGPVATSPRYLNDDLFGKDGVYTNYISISGRKFTFGDTASSLTRTTIVNNDTFTSSGGVTTTQRLDLDNKYLFYELTVSNGTGNEIYPISPAIKMIKQQPALSAFTTSLSGVASPNEILTFDYNIENYYYNRVDQTASKIKWWRSTDGTASGTLLKEETLSNTATSITSTLLSGSSTYTIGASADNDKYIVVEILAVNSWTVHNSYLNGYQLTLKSLGPVKAPYTFAFGKTLYVGTNGYIGLDAPNTGVDVPTTGRNINIMGGKDWQMSTIYYWSNADTYTIRYDGYEYLKGGQEAYRATYQIKFFTNTSYVDYKIIRWGSSLTMPATRFGMYAEGVLVANAYPGPFVYGAGTTMRVYYNGDYPVAYVAYTEIPAAVPNDAMIDAGTVSAGSADDGYLSLLTAANQYNPPTLTSVVPSSTSTGISATFNTSADYNGHYYIIRTGSHSGTLISSSSSSNGSFAYTGLNAGTTYYVTLQPYNSQGQTGTSSQFSVTTSSTPTAFNINSGTKAKPATSFGTRTVTFGWTTSTNAAGYEVQLEGSSDGVSWTVCTGRHPGYTTDLTLSLANSPYVTTTSITLTNVAYYKYYRATARARGSDYSLATAAYSNSGNSATYGYFDMAGSSPAAPTIGTITVTKTTASIPFTFPTNTGSNYVDWIQLSLDNSTFNNDYTSPYDFSSLTAGTAYTLYYRTLNYDGLYSSTLNTPFTTTASKPPNTPAAPTAGTTDNTSIAWSWSAPTVDSTHLAATGYEYAHTTSASTPTSGWTATTATSVTISSLTKNTTYYMHIRATNADGTSGSSSASKTTTNVTLTSYTITYSANGGASTPAVPTSQTTTGSVTTAAVPAFTRDNCNLGTGWNTNAAGTGTNVSASASYTPTADVTLYAKWTAKAVTFTNPTVTFVGNAGSGTTSTKTWNWTTGAITNGTAAGYEWAISSTSGTSGFGAFSATTTARTLTLTVANASTNFRWLKVRKVGSDGLGARVVSGTNTGV